MRSKPMLAGVDRRARLVSKIITICSLIALLILLYVSLNWLMMRRLEFSRTFLFQTLTAVIVAALVVPLHNRLRSFISKRLRHEWQSSQELLRDIGIALSRTLNPDGLHTILIGDLPRRLGLHSATLWMLAPPNDHAFVVLGQTRRNLDTILLVNGKIVRHLGTVPQFLILPSQSDPSIDWSPVLSQGVRLLIPLYVGQQLIGIYGCGAPRRGNVYSPRVLNVLLMLAPAIASALENARAYTKIAQLNQDLRALDQLKDEFIQSVGHELRTPLTSLSLATQLLTRQSGMPPALANVTRVGVTQLEALVERVLEFDLRLNPTAEAQQVQTVPIPLAPLLTLIVDEYAPIAAAKGMHFNIQVPLDLSVWGHEASLHRALHEVVDNAVRYSETGTVSVNAMLHDGLAIVSISDEGPGIPHRERHWLFAAFYRGSSTRSLSATPGAGLGLSIANRDIKAINGQIWLEKSGPSGSTVCVALPTAPFADQHPHGEEAERAVGV